MNGLIRTLGGDIEPAEAGPIYAHEHLIIDSPLVAETMAHIHLPSVEEGVAEVDRCLKAGVRTMVDAMPAASGRDPDKLTRISILSGMKVLAVTGLHTARYYEDVNWTRTETPEQLADRFVADIEDGVDRHDYLREQVHRTEVRAGVIKVAALTEELTPRDERVFEAGALAHERTGAPILTHTEGGLGGIIQIEKLLGLGVAPHRIALSHTDKLDDFGYHQDMLSAGVFLCYDQGIRTPEKTASLVNRMTEVGFGNQIVLGTDGARRSLWSTLGGSPGLAYLYSGFTDMLDGPTDDYFTINPQRWLAFGS
jgi:phosphotriesterase-related protein